jgi:hypothetical protein
MSRSPVFGPDVDFHSRTIAGHAKRTVAQPVSNGTLISGSDRL